MHLDSIQPSARIFFALCSLALLAIILAMIRRNAIKEKYALLWLPLGLGFMAMSLFPDLLLEFSAKVHLHYMTVVVLAVILVFTNIQLYFTIGMSRLREDVKNLAQEIALLRTKADKAENAEAKAADRSRMQADNAASGWVPARASAAGAQAPRPNRPAAAP